MKGDMIEFCLRHVTLRPLKRASPDKKATGVQTRENYTRSSTRFGDILALSSQVRASLTATHVHQLQMHVVQRCTRGEKRKVACKSIFGTRKKEGLLTCKITPVGLIGRSDQLNGIYPVSSEEHRELLSSLR